jgi:hypothetical protein
MMRCNAGLLSALALWGLFGLVSAAGDQDKEVKPTKNWTGQVTDEALLEKLPPNGYITEAKAFKQLWDDWKLGEKVPEIDFKKNVVIVATTRGGNLRVGAVKLTDKGDLRVLAIATMDLRPGFRYAVLAVPREGVKSINGKEFKEKDLAGSSPSPPVAAR